MNNIIYSWGRNNHNQLGQSPNTKENYPVKSNRYVNWESISSGNFHSISLKQDGTLWSWGRNNYGQLGLDSISFKEDLKQIGTDTTWSIISCGYNHTLALKQDGTLWSWGKEKWGRLGHNQNPNIPVQIGTNANWESISGGGYHSLAIKTDGTLWSWGRNNYGQLGLNDNIDRYIPIQVGTDTDWEYVSSGNCHSLAIKTDGTLWSWGRNNYGQLGLNNDIDSNVPVQVGTDTDWKSINCGDFNSFSLKQNGTLGSCGYNRFGQLGISSYDNKNTFTQIGIDTDWYSINIGRLHSVSLKQDGTLWSWGINNYGQLGLNDNIDRYTPTQIGIDTNWLVVDSSQNFTTAIKESEYGIISIVFNIEDAQWKIDNENEWYNSDEVVSLDSGTYIIEFKEVEGFYTPDNITISIDNNDILTEVIDYEVILNPLNVVINSGAVTDGAQWRIEGSSIWYNSNDTIFIENGEYNIIFKTIDGGLIPDTINVILESGDDTNITANYIESLLGTVTVTIDHIDGKWKPVDTNFGYSSDKTLSLEAGTYTIEFKEVEGWEKPDNIDITIIKNQNITENVNYTEIILDTGILLITINPEDVNLAGAQWRILDGLTGYFSGDEISLEVGTYTIEFKEVDEWDTPSNIDVTITNGVTTSETVNYTETEYDTGNLSISISPENVRLEGAKWKDTNSSIWNNSDDIVDLSIGSHVIEFKEVEGWKTPDNMNVTIENNTEILRLVSYIKLSSSLQVDIDPDDINGQWTVTDAETSIQVDINIDDIDSKWYIKVAENIESDIRDDIDRPVHPIYIPKIPDIEKKGKLIIRGSSWKTESKYASNDWIDPDVFVNLPEYSYTIQFKKEEGYEKIPNRIIDIRQNDISELEVTPLLEVPSSRNITDPQKISRNSADLLDSFGSLLKSIRNKRRNLDRLLDSIFSRSSGLLSNGFTPINRLDDILNSTRNSIFDSIDNTKYGIGEYTGTCLNSVFNNTKNLINDIYKFLLNLFPSDISELGILNDLLRIKGLILNGGLGDSLRRLLKLLECLSNNDIMSASDWDQYNREINDITRGYNIGINGDFDEGGFFDELDIPGDVKSHLRLIKDKVLLIPEEVVDKAKELKDISGDEKFEATKMDWKLY